MFATYASDPEVTRYLGWPRHASLAATVAFVSDTLDEWRELGTGTYLIERDGVLLGSTGLHVEGPDHVSTGYALGRRHWGHGYATEACRAMVELARSRGPGRLDAHCHAAHHASARVLEKAGLALEAVLPAHIVFPNLGPALEDVRLYALTF